ncbi:hypothetical protein FPV67DRAFT_1776357 [Lyophyllum atratum]|nr:hypothetical protein FPV67DRAFT_1776357 [Lyophyllum atratum]
MITDSENGNSVTLSSTPLGTGTDSRPSPVPITSMNFDTLTKICEFLDAGTDGSQVDIKMSKNHLLCTALVCKTFLDPALDSLWRSMDSIVPLLRLLPTLEVIDDVYLLRGKVEDEDMSRFRSYAQRIRIYSLDTRIQPAIAPFTLTQFTLPLLPALRHLRCSSYRPLLTSSVPLLLSPTLERFELMNATPDNRIVGPFLYTLQIHAPDLKRLVLRGLANAETLDSIVTFHQLRFLELSGSVTLMFFQQIAALPELQSLDVEFGEPSPSNASHTPNVIFTKLETLKITGYSALVGLCFLCMRGGCLKEITVVLREIASMSTPDVRLSQLGYCQWDHCLSTISSRWAATLRSLTLHSSLSFQTTSGCFLRSLSKLRLERLHILGWWLSVRQCEELAPTIPRIKELRIHIICTTNKPEFPWRLFRVFAQSCRDAILLQMLLARFSSDTAFPLPDGDDHSDVAHGLKFLIISSMQTFQFAGLRNTLDVARYLDRLFPHLQIIRGASDVKSPGKFWDDVSDVIQCLQGARRDSERRRVVS